MWLVQRRGWRGGTGHSTQALVGRAWPGMFVYSMKTRREGKKGSREKSWRAAESRQETVGLVSRGSSGGGGGIETCPWNVLMD